MTSILDTGKDGYCCDDEFDRRTKAALNREPSEWGDPGELFERDAVEVLEFVQGDYQIVAPILAGLRRYRILDLGCGYGRLVPFLASFGCAQYVGVERNEDRFLAAEVRWDTTCDHGVNIIYGDALSLRLVPELWWGQPFDVVWTSNVLQHFTIPDKLRLVETMKACRAPGGICLLREEEIWDRPRVWCEGRYARAEHAKHMIPVPVDELAEAFRPLVLRHLGGNVWQASEE